MNKPHTKLKFNAFRSQCSSQVKQFIRKHGNTHFLVFIIIRTYNRMVGRERFLDEIDVGAVCVLVKEHHWKGRRGREREGGEIHGWEGEGKGGGGRSKG